MKMNIEDLEPRLLEAAKLMELLSQPVRLRLLCGLAEGERSVQEMADDCDLSQPAMSHHLAKLRAAGFVATRREGQTINYSISAPEVKAVLAVLHDLFCASAAPEIEEADQSQQPELKAG